MRNNNDFLIWLISLEAVIQFYSNFIANSPKFVDNPSVSDVIGSGWSPLRNLERRIFRGRATGG
jgi:hypothetical protein